MANGRLVQLPSGFGAKQAQSMGIFVNGADYAVSSIVEQGQQGQVLVSRLHCAVGQLTPNPQTSSSPGGQAEFPQSATSAPAAGTAASATLAAGGAGQYYRALSISWSAVVSTLLAAGVTLTVVLRNGASGVGAIVWQKVIGLPNGAAVGTMVAGDIDVNIFGSSGTAMTLEFTAGNANVLESVTLVADTPAGLIQVPNGIEPLPACYFALIAGDVTVDPNITLFPEAALAVGPSIAIGGGNVGAAPIQLKGASQVLFAALAPLDQPPTQYSWPTDPREPGALLVPQGTKLQLVVLPPVFQNSINFPPNTQSINWSLMAGVYGGVVQNQEWGRLADRLASPLVGR